MSLAKRINDIQLASGVGMPIRGIDLEDGARRLTWELYEGCGEILERELADEFGKDAVVVDDSVWPTRVSLTIPPIVMIQ